MNGNAPIGVFDSGAGGLATLHSLVQALPNESFIYYGDSLHAPYGVRPREEICALSLDCARFLAQKGCKALVVACNTASSAAVETLRAEFEMPIVAMEPAIRPAAKLIKNGYVLVMATYMTLHQTRYINRIRELEIEDRTLSVPCPKLVEAVERGITSGHEAEAEIQTYLAPYADKTVDAIVLGCTHFLHMKQAVRNVSARLWPQAQVIDGDEGTARQLVRILDNAGIRSIGQEKGVVTLFTSDTEQTLALYRRLYELLDAREEK
ncbi:MAG: glutamate racemase [Clostridia bacterium]|nr:glutamate racemase [Clostridia bacterium]